MVFVSTGDRTYGFPVKPRVKIYSQDGSTLYHTWDGFSGSNPFKLVYIDAEDAVGESGTWNLIIDDWENVLDESKLRNTLVHIEFGKDSSYTNGYYIIGPARGFRINRPRTGSKDYQIRGFGDWIRAAELLLLIRMASRQVDLTSNTPKFDKEFTISQQLSDAITKRKWRPLNREDIQEVTGWLVDGIRKTGITNPVINEVFTTLWDFASRMSAATGFPVFMDYKTGQRVVTMKPTSQLHSGAIIKSGDLKLTTDDATRVAYIKDAFVVDDDSSIEAGVASRLYTSQIIDKSTIYSQNVNKGSQTTTFRAICQQVVITNDARRIDSAKFIMSKVGDPTSPKDRVNGDIVLDNGSDKPTGTVLDTFSIPISSIENKPTTVEVTDLNVKEKKLEGGTKKVWFRIFQRSNEVDVNGDPDGNGNPNHGTKHTIKWHHNGVFNTAQTLFSGSAPEGDMKKKDKLKWSVNNQGPLYCLEINSNIKRLLARTNQTSKQTMGLIERYIDTSWIQDPTLASKFLSLILSQTSKARRTVPDFRVTIPNNFLFRKYQNVTFTDTLSRVTQDLQVQRVRYVVSALPGDPQIGAFHCDISLGGLYNSLLASCGCA